MTLSYIYTVVILSGSCDRRAHLHFGTCVYEYSWYYVCNGPVEGMYILKGGKGEDNQCHC